jgi:flagellar biogenesis protein FliO
MKLEKNGKAMLNHASKGGLAGWLLERLRGSRRQRPRLALLERISLAPRQSLALVEAEGCRFLVATSPEGAPAFYALDEAARGTRLGHSSDSLRPLQLTAQRRPARVSW